MAEQILYDYVTIEAPLVSLQVIKDHLHITDTARDADISRKLAEAQQQILEYLKAGADPTWTESTVPLHVAAAIERYTTHLYEHRGDDMTPSGAGGTPAADIWSEIERMLERHRDPAIA